MSSNAAPVSWEFAQKTVGASFELPARLDETFLRRAYAGAQIVRQGKHRQRARATSGNPDLLVSLRMGSPPCADITAAGRPTSRGQ
jgi:hypothetical protein